MRDGETVEDAGVFIVRQESHGPLTGEASLTHRSRDGEVIGQAEIGVKKGVDIARLEEERDRLKLEVARLNVAINDAYEQLQHERVNQSITG